MSGEPNQPDVEFSQGQVLAGRLKVVRRLGAGGVGAVYEVEHLATRHRRALKVLHPRFRDIPQVVERFLREASAAGRIGNAHIVETFDAGTLESGAPWLLMELLEGLPLSEVLRRNGRLDFGPACALMLEVSLAIQAAHDAGIVHRDLKPDNLFVAERDGRPFAKVLDFGMSKFDSSLTGALSMTAEGTTLGTPLYMAPEQMRGAKDVDARADVYALGVILYEALAGGVPYNAPSFAELAVAVLGGNCPLLQQLRPQTPAGLSSVVHRAFAIDPAVRFPSARALAEALRPWAGLPSTVGAWWHGEPALQVDEGLEATSPSRPSPLVFSNLAAASPALGGAGTGVAETVAPSSGGGFGANAGAPGGAGGAPGFATGAGSRPSGSSHRAPRNSPLASSNPGPLTNRTEGEGTVSGALLSSGFRRATSLKRRLLRLGIVAAALFVGGGSLYRRNTGNEGNEGLAPSISPRTPERPTTQTFGKRDTTGPVQQPLATGDLPRKPDDPTAGAADVDPRTITARTKFRVDAGTKLSPPRPEGEPLLHDLNGAP